jgi:hypothetical protein
MISAAAKKRRIAASPLVSEPLRSSAPALVPRNALAEGPRHQHRGPSGRSAVGSRLMSEAFLRHPWVELFPVPERLGKLIRCFMMLRSKSSRDEIARSRRGLRIDVRPA